MNYFFLINFLVEKLKVKNPKSNPIRIRQKGVRRALRGLKVRTRATTV